MDEAITLILIIGIVGLAALFIFYIFKTYIMPKKIDELGEMIKSGQVQLAIKKLKTLLEENSRDPLVHFLLAEAYYKQGSMQQAMMEYKQVLKIGSLGNKVKEEQVRSRLAKLYLENKNLEEAKKEFLILTKLEPSNAENFFQVGSLFENAGFGEKALPYYKQAVKIDGKHEKAFFHMGALEYTVGSFQDAKLSLTETVKLNPANYQAHYYLGMCLKNQKDFEWALKEFDLALKDNLIRPKVHMAKGMCYIEKEQYPKAITEFERGLSLAQKSSEIELNIRYYLAVAAERMRDFHVAIQNWERISDVNSNFKDVKEKLRTYDEFRTDDAIKDFMIASPGKFEMICRQIVESMELSIIDVQVLNDSEVYILATEMEGKWRNTKRSNRLIYIFRTTDPISEKSVRQMHENMRQKGATRGVCLTTSEFSVQAQEFCQSRPIELKERSFMIQTLRSFM
ncbi:MAG: tetratricopeptide repeat protein [Spirochaetia bacterium]|nr:tetratricopeptide repeat protein [Spirochaetia bacterium]